MANIIDISYFQGRLAIAQLVEASVQAELSLYIRLYEPAILKSIFGAVVYDGVAEFAPLIADATLKDSFVADFIWCKYTLGHKTTSTGTGEKTVKAANATEASPNNRVIEVWNEMVDKAQPLIEYLLYNHTFYGFPVVYTWAQATPQYPSKYLSPITPF